MQPAGSVETNHGFRVSLFFGALVPTVLGLGGLGGGAAGLTEPDTVAVRIVAVLVGAVFLAVGGGLYWWLFVHPPRAWLDVDGAGISARHTKGDAIVPTWRLGWNEVTAASVVRTRGTTEFAFPGTSRRRLGYRLPTHYLVLSITGAAAARPDVAADRFEAADGRGRVPPTVLVDLGTGAGLARQVIELLGGRVQPPHVRRLERRALIEDVLRGA